MWPIWVCCKRLDQKRDKYVQSSSEIQLTLKRITKGKESGKKCGEMSRERAKQREATKHIYPTSSLRDMLHGVASAWVIRKLSQGNLCPRIQQRNASYASETKRERVERRILSVTFNLCGLTMEKNRGGKCSRRLVRGLWLSRFRRDLPSLPDSPPYYHISQKRLENSQIYERTSGQINTPSCHGPSSASAEFYQRQDAKWTDIIPFPIRRIRTERSFLSQPTEEWLASSRLRGGPFDWFRRFVLGCLVFWLWGIDEWTVLDLLGLFDAGCGSGNGNLKCTHVFRCGSNQELCRFRGLIINSIWFTENFLEV